MTPPTQRFRARVEACDCLTPFGNAAETAAGLLAGRTALAPTPVLGRAGGEPVPLALLDAMDEALPPRWLRHATDFARRVPAGEWGGPRHPVVVTSSNFGVGSLHAFTLDSAPGHLEHGTPFAAVEKLRAALAWGNNVHVFSHACVTAHLGLAHAARLLEAGLADRALVLSYDLVSPFVAGGFHSLKILNAAMPAPFSATESGAIGLGDGLAFAVLAREGGRFSVGGHVLHNEMHHFTANQSDGSGFTAIARAIAAQREGRRVWVKGHGTGTLEAGRLEAEAWNRELPGAPLVSWKGGLGHTLGSCGLVELAVTLRALEGGRIPGTVGATERTFSPDVSREAFPAGGFDAAVLASNAFGGAHAAFVVSHD
jgi:hypothetical protein